MSKIGKINAKNVQAVFMYLFGYLAIVIVELLSIDQAMGDTNMKLSFNLNNLINRLPSLLTSYAAIAFYTAAALGQAITKFKEENDSYKDLEKNINLFAKDCYKPTTFNKYCIFVNKKRKINAWRAQCFKEWKKLEKKQTYQDINDWEKFSIELKQYQEDKKTNPNAEPPQTESKYCLRRWRLETNLSPEYIEENIEKLRLKFKAINAGVVLGGCKANNYGMEEDEYITTNKATIVFVERAPSSLMMMGTIAIVTSFTIDAFSLMMHWTVWLMFILKLFIKLFSMINTIYSTTKYADSYNQKVTMKDIRFRWGICCEYKVWYAQELKRQEEKKKEIQNGSIEFDKTISIRCNDTIGELNTNRDEDKRDSGESDDSREFNLPVIYQQPENIPTN